MLEEKKEVVDIFENLEKPKVSAQKEIASAVDFQTQKFSDLNQQKNNFPKIKKIIFWVFLGILFLVLLFLGAYKIFAGKLLTSKNQQEQSEEIAEFNSNEKNFDQKEDMSNKNSPNQKNDSDQDGLSDDLELSFGTDILKIDTDGDLLSDFDEKMVYQTDPLVADTDGDGYLDGDEVKNGYNPKGDGQLLNFNAAKNLSEEALNISR